MANPGNLAVSRFPRPRKVHLLAIAACVPCCLPLLIPAVAALAALAGGFSAWSIGYSWYAAVAVAVAGFFVAFVLLRRRSHDPDPQSGHVSLPLVDEWRRQ